ncbi:carboxypeptidase-like regulatory domain-containing protein [Mesonia aquimarina]|uniref:carboxypeptidase-like regulatory domain-containing protein n=1 Tax=Mesonia aquimarina TaxID=1504967 RepID=UPI000EF569F7|nr:carboxypeptidase-like regulatory domain-containing protein [Mesonia aquimarina]
MKLKFLSVFLCLIFFSFYSCEEINIESDKRVTVSGRLIDSQGKPISNIPINTEVESYRLGEGITDENGNFLFTSLQSESNDFLIYINKENIGPSTFSLDKANYSAATILNFQEDDILNVDQYTLGTIILPEKALLDFTIQKTSAEDLELTWSLSLFMANCQYSYKNNIVKIEGSCPQGFEKGNILSNENPNFSQTFTTLKNKTVMFTYSLGNSASQSINIPITDQLNTYVFEY